MPVTQMKFRLSVEMYQALQTRKKLSGLPINTMCIEALTEYLARNPKARAPDYPKRTRRNDWMDLVDALAEMNEPALETAFALLAELLAKTRAAQSGFSTGWVNEKRRRAENDFEGMGNS